MIFLFLLASFLLGSIPFGLITGRIKGVDLRKMGSGNIGATNVYRSIGKKEALFTLVADMGKGLIPVLAARQYFHDEISIGLIAFSAVAGHVFSVFLKFRGGKGVATAIGAIAGFYPLCALVLVIIWILVFALTKVSSMGAVLSFLLLPVVAFLLGGSKDTVFIIMLISILIIIRHKDNIIRIAKGEEARIAKKG